MFDKYVDLRIMELFASCEEDEWEAYVASEGLTPIRMVMGGVYVYEGPNYDHHERWEQTVKGWLIEEQDGRSAISEDGEDMADLLECEHDYADYDCI